MIMIAIAMNGSKQGSFPQTASMYQNPAFSIIWLALSEKRVAVICGGPAIRHPGSGRPKTQEDQTIHRLPHPRRSRLLGAAVFEMQNPGETLLFARASRPALDAFELLSHTVIICRIQHKYLVVHHNRVCVPPDFPENKSLVEQGLDRRFFKRNGPVA